MNSTEHLSQSKFDRWAIRGLVVLTILVSALAMSPSVADPDLWGHIQFGREVIADRAIPESNGYSFTSNDYRWINHENLSEIVLALTVDTFGNQGLLWGKLLLSLFIIGTVMWVNIRSGVAIIPTCILTVLVAWNLGYHFSFRPQISSFFFYTLLLLLLQVSFKAWQGRWHLRWVRPAMLTRGDAPASIDYSWWRARLLWLAPLLFLFWTNSHGGFVAGVCVYVAYLGCRSLEMLSNRWPQGWGYLLRFGLMASAAVLVTFVNPYSWRLPAWLIESLGTPRPEIDDWSSAQLFGPIGLKFWALIAVSVFALLRSRKSLDFTHTVILAITLWQAMSHFRHVPFFALAAGFWIGPHLGSALAARTANERPEPVLLPWQRIGITTGLILMMGLLGYRLNDRLSQLRVDREVFPVDAFQYMSDQDLGGRLVVTYDWAQYAIGAFGVEENLNVGQPKTAVAFDGRFRTCYPQEVVDMHFDLLFGSRTERSRSPRSGPIDPTRVLSFGQPNLVLIRRQGELSEQVMQGQKEQWILLYEDKLAQLWGARATYDNPENPEYIAPDQRIYRNEMPQGYVSWPAFPINTKIDSNIASR